jgi:transaldolase
VHQHSTDRDDRCLCEKLPLNEEEIEAHISSAELAGIDLSAALDTLKKDGLEQFKVAFAEILKELE